MVATPSLSSLFLIVAASCSDSSPPVTDAAAAAGCSCSTAEPPLADRIVEVEQVFTVQANSFGQGMGVACPFRSIALSGGCAATGGSVPHILLEQDVPGESGWDCSWSNPTSRSIDVRAIVRCLVERE